MCCYDNIRMYTVAWIETSAVSGNSGLQFCRVVCIIYRCNICWVGIWYKSYITIMYMLLTFRGMSAGIHISCSSETCRYILKDCKATVAVVGNQMLLNQIIKVTYIFT